GGRAPYRPTAEAVPRRPHRPHVAYRCRGCVARCRASVPAGSLLPRNTSSEVSTGIGPRRRLRPCATGTYSRRLHSSPASKPSPWLPPRPSGEQQQPHRRSGSDTARASSARRVVAPKGLAGLAPRGGTRVLCGSVWRRSSGDVDPSAHPLTRATPSAWSSGDLVAVPVPAYIDAITRRLSCVGRDPRAAACVFVPPEPRSRIAEARSAV